MPHNKTALEAFLTIGKASDKPSCEIMVRTAEEDGVESPFTGTLAPCWKAGTQGVTATGSPQ